MVHRNEMLLLIKPEFDNCFTNVYIDVKIEYVYNNIPIKIIIEHSFTPDYKIKKTYTKNYNNVTKLYDDNIYCIRQRYDNENNITHEDAINQTYQQNNNDIIYQTDYRHHVAGNRTKKIRKHKGINQSGGNKGKLKKGYRYTGERTKTGLAKIKRVI